VARRVDPQGFSFYAAQAASQHGPMLFIGQQGEAACQEIGQFDLPFWCSKKILMRD
jgi:hypothetical protein